MELVTLKEQGKARQGKARPGEARRGEARRGEARQGKARQGKARQGSVNAVGRLRTQYKNRRRSPLWDAHNGLMTVTWHHRP